MKVFIVRPSSEYSAMWQKHGHEVVSTVLEADIVQFTGGEDVTPLYYKHPKHPYTHNNPSRDATEKAIFQMCVEQDIPMVGICRGGQFLNVMSGGTMFQHVEGHGGDHLMKDIRTGKELLVSSTHHQMMNPGPGGEVIAYANNGGMKIIHRDDGFKEHYDDFDVEVVFYPLTRCLCFQPHPEFSGFRYEPMQLYYMDLINEFFSTELA